ncbi:MAG: integration host factor subunit beta [Phycisphaerae bacterium]|nr:integration host factor subunit beta [Phycisphaerae bacterium]
MTKSDLAERVAEKKRTSPKRAGVVIDVILDCLRDSLRRGERIEVRGVGAFRVRHYEAYRGHNPKTGDPIQVKPKRLPYFKPSVALLRKMNRRLWDSPAKGTVIASDSGSSPSRSLRDPSGPYDVA